MALALLMQASGEASAAERTVYTGTLQGVGDIVMELDSAAADGELTGRYFYPKNGVDIPLKGTGKSLTEPLTYQAAKQPGAKPAATWQGTLDAQGYRGVWAHQPGRLVHVGTGGKFGDAIGRAALGRSHRHRHAAGKAVGGPGVDLGLVKLHPFAVGCGEATRPLERARGGRVLLAGALLRGSSQAREG
ncbi:hypothetical protein [Achromobacter animicus]|uniref:hypothetical protein n=1 Tax=Achromobacter animicus TaxID=1389935 RepID=UPI0028B13943|nr:hypothetical protein [Achromobacter animicus]